jgi:hypothetical protein
MTEGKNLTATELEERIKEACREHVIKHGGVPTDKKDTPGTKQHP